MLVAGFFFLFCFFNTHPLMKYLGGGQAMKLEAQ